MTADSSQPINAAANDLVSLKLAFANHNTSVAVSVELTDVSVSAPSDLKVDDGERFFKVDPGKRYETTLTGHTGKPGNVRLQVVSTAKSGRLRQRRTTTTMLDVRVWGPAAPCRFSGCGAGLP